MHRLLFLVGQLSGGGYERQLWYLLGALDRRELHPGVIVWDRRDDEPYRRRIADLGVPIYDLASRGYLGRARELRQLVRQLRPEVLHSWSFYTGLFAWYAMLGRRGLLVSSVRSDYAVERRRVGPIAGTLAAVFPRALIANNQVACRAMSSGPRPRPRAVAYLPNAIPLEDYPLTPPPPLDRFEIIGIGRLSTEKNWQLALHALRQFGQRGGSPWRFRLVGSGPEEATLRATTEALGITDQVEFLGFRDDVPALLASSHVAVLTSDYEGSPNALLEASAAGRPVVATRVGDVPALIDDGQTGWIIAPGDAAALAERLAHIRAHPDAAAEVGRRARRQIAAHHTPETVVRRLLQAYEDFGWRQQTPARPE